MSPSAYFAKKDRLGALLVAAGRLQPHQLERALAHQASVPQLPLALMQDKTTKTELLVMITTYVIESEDVPDQCIRQFQEKANELRQELSGKKKAKKP